MPCADGCSLLPGAVPIVLKISLSQTAIAQPPYMPVFDFAEGWAAIKAAFAQLSLDNYRLLVSDRLYLASYLRSLVVAAISTADPARDRLSRSPTAWRARRSAGSRSLMMLVILPFWTSFLIRIYAWINILQRDGLLNKVLLALGIWSRRRWCGSSTDTAIYIGIVYSYLPFMVLPLYATLEKMDETLLEAAADLGCPPLEGVLAGDASRCRCPASSPARCSASSRSSASSSSPICSAAPIR